MIALTNTDPGQQLGDISAAFSPDWRPMSWDLQELNSLGIQPESLTLEPFVGSWELESSIGAFGRTYELPGTEVVALSMPKMDVSGDYYGFLPLDEGQVGFAIGDACGKGIRAARLMESVYSVLQMRAQICSTAGELLNDLNRTICGSIPEDQFVTFAYGIWDVDGQTFAYSRAGHPPVLHYRAATGYVHELSNGDIVLGICEEVEYSTDSVPLQIGDVLVFYTDGIIEATDATDELFGIQRLTEIVAAYGKDSSEALAAAILGATSQFACQVWEDDVTLMIVKRMED